LGTVITIDYLYFKTNQDINLKRTVYSIFPFLSVAIWAGLGLDFLSNILIFKEAFEVNPQFIFIQTVIAIIILNGALLSDKINQRLIASVRIDNPLPLTPKEDLFMGISGSISIVSWITIAFIDLFVFGNIRIERFSVAIRRLSTVDDRPPQSTRHDVLLVCSEVVP